MSIVFLLLGSVIARTYVHNTCVHGEEVLIIVIAVDHLNTERFDNLIFYAFFIFIGKHERRQRDRYCG